MSELPLKGRSVLVTRARHQAGRLAEELRARGAEVIEIPAIEIVPPDSYEALDEALRGISSFEWLIVTSANTAQVLRERVAALAVGLESFADLKIAAVGAATAQALREAGFTVAVTPREYVAESLVEALGDQVAGQRVLLARAAVARDVIPDALRARGAVVDVVDAYRTVIPPDSVQKIRWLFGAGGLAPDAATFTSSSTVANFFSLVDAAGVELPKRMRAISIGPITSRTLREHGWKPAAEANPHDLTGLLAAVVGTLEGR